ncbi:hypothetical protein [Streptomyces beijiangensis]|uniref:Secreted protein n=1 Tax=Streptomyces beijiangensis TaxID=163361 RepID=A0A939F7M9_9ACTN|nr:hypothetical protein [Streptomyces beijiangensis]MBO0513433.1 hypothetical protein [Streptomyces beijiangensis]
MPRGRHRHSPPLHQLLQPSAIAGASILCAAGAWLFADPVVLRGLVAAAAAAAVGGAVLMRGWDRTAGRRVAELTRARVADEWKTEERIAELEADLEESRELRTRLDGRLRAKRVELAGLRNEHAALLRRYANAETERAGVLESRRLLAIEAASPVRALPAAVSTPTPAAYARAARALENLVCDRTGEAEDHKGKPSAAAGSDHSRPTSALPVPRNVPATAVVPYAPTHNRAVRRQLGNFDFFGNQVAQKAAADLEKEDLADVVGAEALEAVRNEKSADSRGIGQVIDLTAHDETEQIDVAQLRSAIS